MGIRAGLYGDRWAGVQAMKLKAVHHGETNELLGYAHWCAGCKEAHIFYTERRTNNPNAACWTFNGDMEKPTFGPSMRLFKHSPREGVPERTLCHYFLVDGFIDYLPDSSDHDLRGKVLLTDFPPDYGI